MGLIVIHKSGQSVVSVNGGVRGVPGQSVELRTNSTHIQWRLVGDATWINLIALSELGGGGGGGGADGREVLLQKGTSAIQWKYEGDVFWNDLVPLIELKGDTGTSVFNPMTTAEDLVKGGASGTPTRVAKGVDGQLLTMVAGAVAWANAVGFANPLTTSGDLMYGGVSGVPTRLAKGTDGQVLKLVSGLPAWVTLATVATSGAYADLSGKPVLAAVATSGSYADLSGKPTLATVATTGAYTDLSGRPTLATVATTGAYADLIGKPSIPDSPDDIGAATAAQGAKADTAVQSSELGVTVATLVAGVVPSNQLPSFVDDVLEYANYAALPGTGETGKIYVLATAYTSGGITSSQFRWSGSAYAPIIASPGSTDAVTEGSTNLYFTAARVLASVLAGLSTATSAAISTADTVLSALGKLQAQITGLGTSKADLASPTFTGTVAGITKSMVGLGSVDNTADSAKPVSTAQQTALDLKITNPMTTAGDTLYGAASGAPTRLAKGSDGQVLTLASGLPSWATPYSNPMTTSGDILYGGTSGVATRLAKGTNGHYLTLTAGLPAWAALPADAVPTVNGKTGAVIVGAPIIVACSDETTALTSGNGKVTFRMPYAFTLTGVRASLTTAQTSGSILTVDINEGGTTILSTKLTIDNTEKTSTTAATAAVISDTALADDAEITIDIDQIGDGTAKGLKITLIGYQP